MRGYCHGLTVAPESFPVILLVVLLVACEFLVVVVFDFLRACALVFLLFPSFLFDLQCKKRLEGFIQA